MEDKVERLLKDVATGRIVREEDFAAARAAEEEDRTNAAKASLQRRAWMALETGAPPELPLPERERGRRAERDDRSGHDVEALTSATTSARYAAHIKAQRKRRLPG